MDDKEQTTAQRKPRLTWEQPRAYLWTLISAIGWLAFFFVTLAIPPHAYGPSLLSQVGAVLIGVLILLAILLAGARPRWPVSARWGMFIYGAVIILLAFALNARTPELRPWIALGLMAIALPIGYWVGDKLEKITNLIPVAIAFTFADIFSVYQGPSRKVVEQLEGFQDEVSREVARAIATASPDDAAEVAVQAAAMVRAPLADYVIVHFPIPATGASVPVLGVGDFIILALLFRVAWVHGISPLSVLISSLVSIGAALAFTHYIGQAVPALPFIAVGVIGWLLLTNPRLRKLDKQEIVLSVGVAALFLALLAGKYVQGMLG